jgi:hypothetical protein
LHGGNQKITTKKSLKAAPTVGKFPSNKDRESRKFGHSVDPHTEGAD